MLPHPDVCSRWNRLAAVAFAILWVAPLPKWRVYGGLVALCALIAGGDVLAIAEIASEGDEGKRFEVTVFGALAVSIPERAMHVVLAPPGRDPAESRCRLPMKLPPAPR